MSFRLAPPNTPCTQDAAPEALHLVCYHNVRVALKLQRLQLTQAEIFLPNMRGGCGLQEKQQQRETEWSCQKKTGNECCERAECLLHRRGGLDIGCWSSCLCWGRHRGLQGALDCRLQAALGESCLHCCCSLLSRRRPGYACCRRRHCGSSAASTRSPKPQPCPANLQLIILFNYTASAKLYHVVPPTSKPT